MHLHEQFLQLHVEYTGLALLWRFCSVTYLRKNTRVSTITLFKTGSKTV